MSPCLSFSPCRTEAPRSSSNISCDSALRISFVIPESTIPGQMQFTRIFSFASSIARLFVSPRSAAFEAAYAAAAGVPEIAATELRNTIPEFGAQQPF